MEVTRLAAQLFLGEIVLINMKKNISLILLALFTLTLSGNAEPPSPISTTPVIDLVQAGKDVAFAGGYVVHVTKREGSVLEGVHILVPSSAGQVKEITAASGTIKS